MAGALDGVRVVDFGQYAAGPMTARFPADPGAAVPRSRPRGGPAGAPEGFGASPGDPGGVYWMGRRQAAQVLEDKE